MHYGQLAYVIGSTVDLVIGGQGVAKNGASKVISYIWTLTVASPVQNTAAVRRPFCLLRR